MGGRRSNHSSAKHIVMQHPPSYFVPNHVLLHLVVPIQKRQVEVRGRLVLHPTGVGFGPDEGMNDHCCEAEQMDQRAAKKEYS